QAAVLRRVENGLRQDQAIGDDDCHVRLECEELRLGIEVAQAERMADFDAERFGGAMHGGGLQLLAAAGGPGRLRIHRGNVMSGFVQSVERGDRKVRRAHEDDAHIKAPFALSLSKGPAWPYLRRYGIARDRGARWSACPAAGPRPALGAARGAVAGQAPRNRAGPTPRSAYHGARAARGMPHLRQCRHAGPVRDLRRRAPRRAPALRRRRPCRSLGARPGAALPRPLSRARRPAFGAGRGAAGGSHHRQADRAGCGRGHRRSRARHERDARGADHRALHRRAARSLSHPPHAARSRAARRRGARLPRRGHAGAGAAGAAAGGMKRKWIVGGWAFAMVASALLPAWFLLDRIERNHLGYYIDPQTGALTSEVVWQFLRWWLPIALPVSLLALACMALNRPNDPPSS